MSNRFKFSNMRRKSYQSMPPNRPKEYTKALEEQGKKIKDKHRKMMM